MRYYPKFVLLSVVLTHGPCLVYACKVSACDSTTLSYELQRASITYNDYTSPFIQTKYASLEAFKVQFGVEF